MPNAYDIIIIGTGTAARVAAIRARKAGKRVAVIDFRPYGGTCALRGCDPKKMLVSGASVFDYVHRFNNKGITDEVRIDWQDLMAFKRSFTDAVPEKQEQLYAEMGIDTFHGRAKFTGPRNLRTPDDSLEAEQILIASGAEPIRLGIPGEEYLITNEQFLVLETLPRKIILVGGGYIAAEFSHIAARAGAHVTIIQRGPRILKHFDPDLVGWLSRSFDEAGIEVRTELTVESIERTDQGYKVHTSSRSGTGELEADCVIHAAGRTPALESLEPGAANIAVENGRLRLNKCLQSISNPAVYAAGDAAQIGPPLTPVSSHDAKVAIANMVEGNHQMPDYKGVPSVAFTLPPIASVGLREAQARDQGLKFSVKSQLTPNWFTARQAAEAVYGFKVMVEDESDLILGAHLVGPSADETINIFGLAIRQKLTAEQLRTTMFAYPTAASDIGSML